MSCNNNFMNHNLFKKKPTIIGMVHFSPLEGSDGFESKEVVLERARQDLTTLQEGGVDAIMFENNFDTPKFAELPTSIAQHFEELIAELVPETKLPWGIVPLWNDYRFGFEMCKKYGGMMVRVPVFVDSVETVYGTFEANAKEVLQAQKEIGVESVLILADVQVKHAKMLHPRPFTESVEEAMQELADGVIVTGTWTGDPPSVEQCAEARSTVGDRGLVLTGSGMTAENLSLFAPHLDGCIVGTAFKAGERAEGKEGPNVVGPETRYDVDRIKMFMQAAGRCQHE